MKKLVVILLSMSVAAGAVSCKKADDSPKPYEAICINDIVIKSEYITDEDYKCPFNVILPADYETSGKRYPVLYLFHGMNGDNHAWQTNGDVVKLTKKAVDAGVIAPFIIVTPNAYLTFFVDDLEWPEIFDQPVLKFESFFTKELQPYVESHFPVLTDREHTAVAGLSMGGYGASYYAFKYPEKYCFCDSFSGAVSGGDWTGLTDRVPSVEDVFKAKGYTEDDFPRLPEYVMDCGGNDMVCSQFNELTHRFLKSIDFPHKYRMYPGEHNWDYWRPAYERMLPELAEHFGK
ncbi:MAG: hypothetical protein MJY55_06990 [Bacteroidales bacterium]|nr:hypothetical protein [Bacteroidales bacterium]